MESLDSTIIDALSSKAVKDKKELVMKTQK